MHRPLSTLWPPFQCAAGSRFRREHLRFAGESDRNVEVYLTYASALLHFATNGRVLYTAIEFPISKSFQIKAPLTQIFVFLEKLACSLYEKGNICR